MVTDEQLSYWREQLSGIESLALPTDRMRPPVRTFESDALDIRLGRALGEALSQLSRECDTTPSGILLSVLELLLARYSGQSDICLGISHVDPGGAGREGAAVPLRSFLVLRTEVTPELDFGELVSRVEERTRQAHAHGEVPLDRLVDEILGEHERTRDPLFQVTFAFEDRVAQRDADLPATTEDEVKRRASQFDLAFEFRRQADQSVDGSVEYSRDLYDASTIERMVGQFRHLLEQVVEAPGTPIGEFSIVTEREREELARWNATEVVYPRDRCLHELFEARAAAVPDSCALSFIDHELSYAELNRRSNQFGHRLREMGVGPDVLVGICMDRTEDLVIALMGTLKAGGAYVPLDPEYPRERLNLMIEDAQPLVVISESQYADLLTCDSSELFLIDREGEGLASESERNLSCISAPENLAYVIYTSGSTGKPKGVMVEHRNAVNFLTGMERSLGISDPGVWIGVTSISFDISVLEIFGSLAWGFELAFYPGPRFETSEGESLISRLLRERRVTTLQCTPSLVEILLDDPEARKWLEKLDRAMIGGEALPTALAGELLEVLRGELYNVYGPTETTIWSTVHLVQPEDPEMGSIPIGHPIANTTLFVLDANDQPLPAGLVGELVIGGVGVTRGYFNRPELTQERFPTASFEAARGERLYRTGDLARFRAGGTLECLGRIDFQVKISGHRIELGEIESVLERHDSVQKAVVVAREDASGSKRLVAYVKSAAGGADAEQAQREHLRELLPEFMVPPYFVYLAEYPLTPNGKVDRKALPEPEGLSIEGAEAFTAPRNPTEERLAEIWADVLKLEQVGVRQNFIELGGHSLLAARVASRVWESFGVELPLRSLFDAPTVETLAGLIDGLSEEGVASKAEPLVRVPRDQRLPLSSAQLRMWVMYQHDPESSRYSLPSAFRVSGRLDAEALRRAFEEIVRRHESLRTRYQSEGGEPYQQILDDVSWELPLVDLTILPEAQREHEMQRLADEEARRPFDLAAGVVLRTGLIRLTREEHVLMINIHHIVSDDWSTSLFRKELKLFYAAFSKGETLSLPDIEIQYADFAHWEQGWMESQTLCQQTEYWREKIRGVETLQLPADRPRPPMQSYAGGVVDFELSDQLREGLMRLSREQDATLFMTLLAAFKVLLARWSGQSDICVGTPIANRGQVELESIVGLFLNTLALRTDVSLELTFEELLARIKECTLQAYMHRDLPFERLVEEAGVKWDPSCHPLFQVMFAFENEEPGIELDALTLRPVRLRRETALLDLTLSVSQCADQSLITFMEYSRDLYDASTIERMVGQFRHLLEQVVEAPGTPIGEFSIVTEREREELARWNATEVVYPRDRCLHELFEARAAAVPDSCALSFIDHELSYAELNRRSNQFGHRLREMGVGPDVLVGICMDRTEDLVIALMGTLKAGGAYVPLDPEYPRERLNLMIEDAQPLVVISESQYADLLTCDSSELFLIDREGEGLASESERNLSCISAPENLAYVIYTSGSTGKPKGVMVEHRNAVNFLTGMERSLGISDPGVWIGVTSISFDISVLEIFGSLAWGFELAFYPGPRFETSEGESLISRLLRERRVTTLQCTPSLVEILLDDPEARKWLEKLDRAMIGGEALPTALAGELLEVLRGELYNVYGPTETTIWSTVHLVQPEDPEMGSIPIGHPIANTTLFVLDANDQPLPAGLVGELVIGGVGVTRGYFNRPELTQERFPTASFEAARGERLYRTGDLARFRAGGTLECLGRIDFQVKISGHRIELGEIESVLERHDSVQKAVVVAREDASGSKRLVAYVKSAAGGADAEQAQREHLRELLPEFMVPPYFVYLAEYPLTPNGKVDRKALPEPEGLSIEGAEAFTAPRNPTEERLAEIWADVLKLEQVGVRQNFIELGGHSLLGVRLIMSVNEAFDSNLSVGSIFKASTIRDQAELIRSELEAHDTGVVRLARGEGEAALFCICGIDLYQELANALAPEYTVYGVHVPLEDKFLMAAANDRSKETPPSVPVLAEAYLQEIRRTQPHQPYYLAGVSFGGCVAFEIAQQLRAQGEQVQGLYLIDAILPSSMRRDLPRWVAHQFSETRRRGSRHLVDQLGKVSPSLAAPFRSVVAPDEETRTGTADSLRGIELRRNHSYIAAMRQYEETIRSYAANAILFYAMDRSDSGGYQVAPDCGWERVMRGDFRICNIDVDHLGALRKPDVETLADHIRISMSLSAGVGA